MDNGDSVSAVSSTSMSKSLPDGVVDWTFRKRGFLPEADPPRAFPPDSEFSVLDEIGRDLPSLLHDRGFRQYAQTLEIPLWPINRARPEDIPGLRLYYLRVGFLASAYVNQVGEEPS